MTALLRENGPGVARSRFFTPAPAAMQGASAAAATAAPAAVASHAQDMPRAHVQSFDQAMSQGTLASNDFAPNRLPGAYGKVPPRG